MGEYGYTDQGYSTFNTVRGETRRPRIKPFVPSIPNTNNNSEANVTKKIVVPVSSSRPYGDDDYNKHSPQTEAYPIRNDNYNGTNGYGDYGNGSINFGRKPVAGIIRNDNYDGYNGSNGYGSNKEGRNPIGGSIRNDNHDGYYDGNNGYGDYGNKEGRKPIGSTIKNDNYDGYNGPNGYDGYGEYNNGGDADYRRANMGKKARMKFYGKRV